MSASRQVHEGSCQCGRVRYKVEGPLSNMSNCHCTDCRKNSGAAFVTYVEAPKSAFTYVKGADLVQNYKADSGTKRAFCRQCGSTLGCFVDNDDLMEIAAATLDTPIDLRPEYHIFVRSKVSWYDIEDGRPQFPTTRGQ